MSPEKLGFSLAVAREEGRRGFAPAVPFRRSLYAVLRGFTDDDIVAVHRGETVGPKILAFRTIKATKLKKAIVLCRRNAIGDRFDVFAGLDDLPAAFPIWVVAAVTLSTDQELLLALGCLVAHESTYTRSVTLYSTFP